MKLNLKKIIKSAARILLSASLVLLIGISFLACSPAEDATFVNEQDETGVDIGGSEKESLSTKTSMSEESNSSESAAVTFSTQETDASSHKNETDSSADTTKTQKVIESVDSKSSQTPPTKQSSQTTKTEAKTKASETKKSTTTKTSAPETTSTTTDGKITVTLSISCINALNANIPGTEPYAPGGVILSDKSITVDAGSSVVDVLKSSGLVVNAKSMFLGTYISSIQGISEGAAGAGAGGWIFSVNGAFPHTATSNAKVNDGDRVSFHYTIKNGDVPGAPF